MPSCLHNNMVLHKGTSLFFVYFFFSSPQYSLTCGLNELSLGQLNSITVAWEGEMFEKLMWVIFAVRPVAQTGVECWLAAVVSLSEGENPPQTDQLWVEREIQSSVVCTGLCINNANYAAQRRSHPASDGRCSLPSDS